MARNRKYLFYLFIALINILVIFAVLKALDYAIVLSSRGQEAMRLSDAGDVPSISTFDLYPYTGGHTQAHANRDRSVWTGDHGFFVEIELDRPPAKDGNELRLILIGGSGAAGWGAETNFGMMYRRLERKFNEERPCGGEVWLRVVNMAMGGSASYQNFIALNRWAHALEPDLILSYSGHNDFFVPLDTRSDAFLGFRTPVNLVEATRFASSPGWLKDLAAVFPGLIRYTDIGFILRVLTADPTLKFGPAASYVTRYPAALPGTPAEAALEVMEQIASPMYQHAMASLARDFPGIPILVVSQAYMWPLDKEEDDRYGVMMPVGRYLEAYDMLWSDFRSNFIDIEAPGNPFHFMDFHEYYRSHLMDAYPPGDGIHLSSDKAAFLTDHVAEQAFPLLCARVANRDLDHADGASPVSAPGRLFPRAAAPDLGPLALVHGDGPKVLNVDGRELPVHPPGPPVGFAERIEDHEDGFLIRGWAVDSDAQAVAREVLLVAEGHLVGRAAPRIYREDLATWGPSFADAGWEITVPRQGALRGSLGFYALMADGTTRQLDISPGFQFAADRPAGAE